MELVEDESEEALEEEDGEINFRDMLSAIAMFGIAMNSYSDHGSDTFHKDIAIAAVMIADELIDLLGE
jgi:hypothetical protein